MISMLMRDHPFFHRQDGTGKDWETTVLVRGINPFIKLDKNNLLSKNYRIKRSNVQPANLFENWKKEFEVTENLEEWEQAFDLAE